MLLLAEVLQHSLARNITFNPGTAFDNLDPGDTATVKIPYTVSDGTATATATLTITVNGANDAPIAVNDTGISTTENASVTVNVKANDQVVDGDDTVASLVVSSPAILSVSQPLTVPRLVMALFHCPETTLCSTQVQRSMLSMLVKLRRY